MKETKKEHYVPQLYLRNWATKNSDQVYVYNKQKDTIYISNICDIASERYFYDIDFTGILTAETLKKYGLEEYDLSHLDDGQFIEKFLSREIENDFGPRISKIITSVNNMTHWEIGNCVFLSKEEKFNLSYHLAMQYIRVKAIRESISDSSNCLVQVLHDMGANQESINKYTLQESHLPYIHAKMILDKDAIEDLAKSFFSLTWTLLINETSMPFFTSDSPIGTQAHIQHPFLSMAGLNCRGVESYFPISPNLMLRMIDGDYHSHYFKQDRRIIKLDSVDIVMYYNSRCALNSNNCIYSCTPDFSIIKKMLANNPSTFDQPRTVVNWGGKTYIPH